MYKKSILSNQLRIISNELKDRGSVAIGFWVGVGGRFEDQVNKGAAHFLEHILFRGSLKYSCSDIKGMIEGVGGAINAFTGEEQTCYYAKVPAKHFDQTLEILSDMVFFPLIQKNDLEKERAIILEEIKMYRDRPQSYVMELLDELVWGKHPLGQSLAGTKDSVGQMTQAQLRTFHRCYYSPNNIVVSLCGNFDHDHVCSFLEEKLGNFENEQRVSYEPSSTHQKKSQMKLFKKDIEQSHVVLAMPTFPCDHPDIYILAILNIILGGNMSSRLFDELREKRGLAYSIYSGMKTLDDTGLFLIKAGVDNTKLVESIEVILKILKQVKRGGVKEKEFVRAREYFLGQFILGLEDNMEHMMWIGESMLERNRIRTIGEVVYKINSISIEDIHRVASEVLQPKKMNLAVVGPLKEEQEKNIASLLNI